MSRRNAGAGTGVGEAHELGLSAGVLNLWSQTSGVEYC